VLHLQLGEETGHARVVDGIAVATSLVSKCARQPRLADSGWADEEQIAMLCDPSASSKLLEQPFVELALGSVIDILDTGLAMAQAGRTQADLDPLGIAISHLAINKQREPFGV
jgi:hypothetical protein